MSKATKPAKATKGLKSSMATKGTVATISPTKTYVAHRIALDPNNEQRTYFARAAGTARFAYNWGLAEWQAMHAARKDDPTLPGPTRFVIEKRLNAVKRAQFPWMYDVTNNAAQQAIASLGTAFDAFFAGRGNYPKFKGKDSPQSFCSCSSGRQIKTDGKRIKLAKIGWIRMTQAVRFSGKIKRATVSRTADRWYVSLLIETDDIKPVVHPVATVGVDLGVSTLATLSDGTTIKGPKPHKALSARLKRINRSLSRKRKGSANRRKAKAKLARLHARIANIRRDALHKATTHIAKTYARIGIEDLNVSGMVKNRRLSRAVSDMGFHEFRRQLEYKARWYGATIITADRWYPSSKTCSCCGTVKPVLALSQRKFECEDCGFKADRDHNAALNLECLAAKPAVTACGEERSDDGRKARVKRASGKQEASTTIAIAA